jgi:hypothetical protein
MRHNDAQESLADSVELATLPPIGADGHPQLAPNAPTPPEPPRLCEFGPCRNYHTFRIQLDAAQPLDPEAHGRVTHAERHHYCYPTPGVETNLGSLPVLECNRWVPTSRLFRTKGMVKRAFDRAIDAYKRGQVDAVGEIADVAESFKVSFEIQKDGAIVSLINDQTFERDYPITNIVLDALEMAGFAREGDGSAEPAGHTYNLADDDGPIEHLNTTPALLGLESGARLIINLSPKDPEK